MNESRAVSPIEIVNKLIALRSRGEVPREIEEALWFLQFESTQPGGLEQLARKMVQHFPQRIGPAMVQAAYGRKRLTRAEAVAFWAVVPHRCKGREFEAVIPEAWIVEAADDDCLRDYTEEERRTRERQEKERLRGLPEIEMAALMPILQNRAEREVARALMDFCTIPAANVYDDDFAYDYERRHDPLRCWVFPQLAESLQEFMLHKAEKARRAIGQTAVVAKVFDALDFAWGAGVMVQIEGEPRHGKTEAISTYCAMYRGRARLVTVPCENSDADFYLAIAEGLGLSVNNPGNISAIRREIDFILTNSRLMLIWDEAHFLIPSRYSETTPPSRMNWLRTRVADRGLPTAIMITPQSFDHAFNRFIKKTKYRFEQFFGRIAKFELPATLTREDVIAVAQSHFPEFPLPYLKMIAGRAMQCAGYLQAVEFTAKRARHIAARAGRRDEIEEADVLQAIEEMMPGNVKAATQKRPCTQPAEALQTPSNPRAASVRALDPEDQISSESSQHPRGARVAPAAVLAA